MKKDKFTITFPPMWAYLVIALGTVYNYRLAWVTLGLLMILFTILENLS